MKELQDIIARWRILPPDARALLATVVKTSGSTYRKPGARMLVTESGWQAGSVSGGCLESDILETAWQRTDRGPALVVYDSTSHTDIVWGLGLGCQGAVTVLVERLTPEHPLLPYLSDCLDRRVPGVVVTETADGETLGQRAYGSQPHTFRDPFMEIIEPPLALTVYGGGHDAIPLIRAAKALGWFVTVVDHRSGMATPERFPEADEVIWATPEAAPLPEVGSAAIVMTHHYLTDRAHLNRLIPYPLRYLGQLGPRSRADQLLGELGFDEPGPQFHAPVGLDLGGASPEEVALSIVAEIQREIYGRRGGSLRELAAPIHR